MPRNYKTTQRRRLPPQSSSSSSASSPPITHSSILESITENLGSATSNSSAASEQISTPGVGNDGDGGGDAEEKNNVAVVATAENKKENGEVGLPLFHSGSAFPNKKLSNKEQEEEDGDIAKNYDNVGDAALQNNLKKEEEEEEAAPPPLEETIISPTLNNNDNEEEEEESTIVSEHTNTPMIYVNDSDSVSQITSSIAGSSYYYQPPIRGIGGGGGRYHGRGGGNMSVGDSAAGDSLDEIAFLLNPTPSVVNGVSNRRTSSQQQQQQQQQAASSRYTNRFNNISYNPQSSSSNHKHKSSSSSLYSDSPSTTYQQQQQPPPRSSSFQTNPTPTLPNEDDASSKKQSTILSKITLPTNALSTLQYLRHRVEHYFLPPPLRSSKKNDDEEVGGGDDDEEEVDYFEKLMSPDFLLASAVGGGGASIAPSTLGGGGGNSTINGASTFDGGGASTIGTYTTKGGGLTQITGGGTTYITAKRTKKQKELAQRKFWFTVFRLLWLCVLLSSFLVGLRLASNSKQRKKMYNAAAGGGGVGKVDLGNEKYEWDSNLGMIRPASSLVQQQQGGNVGMGNENINFDIQPGDPLSPLLPSKLRSNNQQQQQQQSMRHIGLTLPPIFDNLADVTNFPTIDASHKNNIMLDGIGSSIGGPDGDLPFFWHIPRTGGATMNDVLGSCLQLTLASDAGGREGHDHDEQLQILKFTQHFSYVNVDTSTIEGIERCKRLNLVSSGLADVVVSSLLHEAASMFTPTNKGRMFTIFRHPIERAVSLFHYVQDTQWRRSANFNEELAELSIEEYFKGGLAENNWMVRFLTGELTKGELTDEDLDLAKEVLRRKCLVGLLKEKGESFARVERYFGWHLKTDSDRECYEKKLEWAWPLKHRHDDVQEGTELWDLILRQNVYDVQLYEYAELLFQEQAQFFQ